MMINLQFKDFEKGGYQMLSGCIAIEAIAYELGPQKITSAFIEEQIAATMNRIGISPGSLEKLTGIRERRFWDSGFMPSEAATLAARKVIDMSGVNPQEIGSLINTSVCKDYIEPSIASLVHGNLKLSPECLNFDIGNACLGFMNAINVTSMMIETGLIKYGLIVDGENAREVVDATLKKLQSRDVTSEIFRENFATLTLGSGAVAMLLCHKDQSNSGHIINGSVTRAATQHSRLCLGQKDSMQADAHGVMVHGVELAKAVWDQSGQTFENWNAQSIDLYIPHQVSIRNQTVLNKTLGIPMEKVYLNLQTLGNIGPAAVPITLAMATEERNSKQGDHIAILSIGSGLNCLMMSITW